MDRRAPPVADGAGPIADPRGARHGWFAVGVALAAPLSAWIAHRFAGLGLDLEGARDALVFLLLAPLLEEWIFRHGLQQALSRRWGAAHRANLVASIAFVALHAPTAGLWAVLWIVPSLALGEVWRRHRRLGLNVAMHAWFNACLWWMSA
jgi:membrane protease YdiL (CAAX protease family)